MGERVNHLDDYHNRGLSHADCPGGDDDCWDGALLEVAQAENDVDANRLAEAIKASGVLVQGRNRTLLDPEEAAKAIASEYWKVGSTQL